MSTVSGKMLRDVTGNEHTGDRDLVEGETVYRYDNCTYGCISWDGIAATLDPSGGNPFFEIPATSVKWSIPQ